MRLSLCAPGSPLNAAPVSIAAGAGQSLSQAIWLSGRVPPLPLCGGLGRCGRCRVRFVRHPPPPLPAETALLPPQDLAAGWRLACRRTVPSGKGMLELELPPAHMPTPAPPPTDACPSGGPPLALAVDLGTTSLCWRALDPEGRPVAQGAMLNPQAGAGADVMSRLAVARAAGGRRRLAALARRAVREVSEGLRLGGQGRVERLCLAANTAMTDIFLDRDVEGLCAAPYRQTHHGDATFTLPGLPPLYVPPLPAPFIGGDVSAGLAALLAANVPRPFLLADMGTNGEMALLGGDGSLWLTSVPLGPALEGVGPQCGRLAGPGAVTAFSLTPTGLDCHVAQGGGTALGISATGYLSLLALLLRVGLLRADGRFDAAPPLPLARRLAASLEDGDVAAGGQRLRLPHGLWLAAADVEALLQVRAAFAVAVAALLEAAALPAGRVAAFCLGGALGLHAAQADLETLGFLPPPLSGRVRAVGNTSLEGAALLLRSDAARKGLAALCARAHVLSLTERPDFYAAYLRHLRFGE